jgi:hypothetical protein
MKLYYNNNKFNKKKMKFKVIVSNKCILFWIKIYNVILRKNEFKPDIYKKLIIVWIIFIEMKEFLFLKFWNIQFIEIHFNF